MIGEGSERLYEDQPTVELDRDELIAAWHDRQRALKDAEARGEGPWDLLERRLRGQPDNLATHDDGIRPLRTADQQPEFRPLRQLLRLVLLVALFSLIAIAIVVAIYLMLPVHVPSSVVGLSLHGATLPLT